MAIKTLAALVLLVGMIPATAAISQNRLLVLFSGNPHDPRLAEQTAMVARAQAGLAERDVMVLRAIGADGEAPALRRKYAVTADFRILLVGKDGHVAMSSAQPIAMDQLFATIDAMPMRQDEMRRRK